jgi:serine/threonine protein phosphatase 1
VLYAVGDIHGEVELLEELLDRIPHGPEDRFVFVGDYVDRGPDSKGVVWAGAAPPTSPETPS